MKQLIAIGMLTIGVGGCASITKGTTQTLVFNVEPDSARCMLTRDGDGEIGSISAKSNTVTVGKDKDDIIVKCTAPGYKQKVTRLVSSAETAGVVGGVFIDLGITDMVTGAMWTYPNTTTISMEKEDASTPQAAVPAPQPAATPPAAADKEMASVTTPSTNSSAQR